MFLHDVESSWADALGPVCACHPAELDDDPLHSRGLGQGHGEQGAQHGWRWFLYIQRRALFSTRRQSAEWNATSARTSAAAASSAVPWPVTRGALGVVRWAGCSPSAGADPLCHIASASNYARKGDEQRTQAQRAGSEALAKWTDLGSSHASVRWAVSPTESCLLTATEAKASCRRLESWRPAKAGAAAARARTRLRRTRRQRTGDASRMTDLC